MSLSNFLSDIAGSFYQPKLNAVGINAKGQPIDAQGNVTSLYSQPNWFERLSPDVRSMAATNAQISGAPLLNQQQAEENISRAQLYGQQPRGIAGMLFSQGTLDPNAAKSASQLFADTDAGLYPAQANAERNVALATSAQNPVEANPDIAQAAEYAAKYGLPAENTSKIFNLLHPGAEQGGLNMFSLNPQTGVTGVVRNPISLYGSMMGGNAIQGPSGAMYPSAPPGTINVPGTDTGYNTPGYRALSGGGQQTQPQTAGATRPLYGAPNGYRLDNDDNLYYNGVYVPEENIKGTPIDKLISHQTGAEKEIKNMRNTANLPHGLGYELGQMGKSYWNESPLGKLSPYISKGYHALIGE
jgi:hypothetical protein